MSTNQSPDRGERSRHCSSCSGVFRWSRRTACLLYCQIVGDVNSIHSSVSSEILAYYSKGEHVAYLNNRVFLSRNYLNNRVFLSRNYRLIVAPRKFDVLKTNICPRSEASRANMLVLRTSNFQGATIRPIVPRHKHSIVFIVHH